MIKKLLEINDSSRLYTPGNDLYAT